MARLNAKTFVKQLQARMNAVAAERDRLDEMINSAEQLRESCDRAWYDLQSARDALSELV